MCKDSFSEESSKSIRLKTSYSLNKGEVSGKAICYLSSVKISLQSLHIDVLSMLREMHGRCHTLKHRVCDLLRASPHRTRASQQTLPPSPTSIPNWWENANNIPPPPFQSVLELMPFCSRQVWLTSLNLNLMTNTQHSLRLCSCKMNATLLSTDPASVGFHFSFKLLIKDMSFPTSRETK